jgi:hypothetical protein
MQKQEQLEIETNLKLQKLKIELKRHDLEQP